MSQLDRRAFVAGVLGAGGVLAARPIGVVAKTDPTKCTTAPKIFKPGQDTRPISPRQNVAALTVGSTWYKQYQAGYQHIRDMDQTDPRSWTQQGMIHAIMCDGSAHEVHQSTRFLAWHRCFLYFHERIIAWGSTGGKSLDPTFRLALWNWEGSDLGRNSTPSFPSVFSNGSLLDKWRQPTYSPGDGNIAPALATHNVIEFYGKPYSAQSVRARGGSPVLENLSHGTIHVDTGMQGTAPPPGPRTRDMGSLSTAGYDPIFFAHHGNIDKVWAWWQKLNPGLTPASTNPQTKQPYDPAWAGTTWQFFDWDGTCWSITAADVVDYTNNLRYTVPAAPAAPSVRRVQLAVAGPRLKGPPPEANAAVSVLLNDLTIPAPGTGRFDLVAQVDGKTRRVGHFAIFDMAMSESKTASVIARLDPQGVAVVERGTPLKVVPEKGRTTVFGITPGGGGTELHASSATLLVQ